MAPDAATLALARRLCEPGVNAGAALLHGTVDDADPLALAWALKEVCYEAWSTEPPRSVRAADALYALAERSSAHMAHMTHTAQMAHMANRADEIRGLSHWTEGIACVTRGQMAEAVPAFDAAASALRAAANHDAAAQTQVPKIMALSLLGQHAQAAACAEAAQRELRALGNLRAAAKVSQNLGSLHIRLDQYDSAARHFREAAVLFARLRDHEHSVLADIGLAGALTGSGDFDEAARIHARARMRAGNQGLELQLAQLDESEGLLDLALGRYREALAGLESARRRYEALAMPQYLAIAEKQLADAYLELRLLPEAQSMFDTAVQRFAELELPDEQAWALAQRSRAEALLGRTDADASFVTAAGLFEQAGNAVGTAAVALARAELALAGGDAAAALAGAMHAAQGFTEAGQADGRSQAEVIRGRALLLAGRSAEAQAVFDTALAQARSLQQTQVQVRCLTGLGLCARAAGDAARAGASFEAAIELFEDQRRALPGDEIRSAFLTDHLRPYEEQLRSALAGGNAAAALWQLERFRARTLDERLAQSQQTPDDDETLRLRERLNWLYRRVQRLQEEGGATEVLQAELLQAERTLLERARRQRLTAPAVLADGAVTFNVAALQHALQSGDVLVEYGVLDDELFACVATPECVTLHRRLAIWPEVLEALRAVQFQLDSLRHGAALVHAHLELLSARLRLRLARVYALVWAPLAACVCSARRLLVVPHAQLGALPFAALSDGERCLFERHELALAPSARAALRGLQQGPLPARSVLALGESSRLPHAGAEAAFVASLFAEGQLYVGEAATLAALRQHAPAAAVLHLACHAQFRRDNPRFSALHLHDAALTVELAEALPLDRRTVVLSACETALADGAAGGEMVGLVRAFLVAGSARVLASQWPVDDGVTRHFMAHFYRALVGGGGAAAALRRAQAATKAEHPHPHYWAAFSLYGGW